MLEKFLHIISAERLDITNKAFESTLAQQLRAYYFCREYVKGKNIIELGCGTAYGTNLLAKYAAKVTAIDNDQFTIRKNINRNKFKNVKFIHKKIEEFFPRKKADVVISFQVIEHIKNVEDFFLAILRILKPGGICIISTPNGPQQSYNENPYHYKEYSSKELSFLASKYFKKYKLFGVFGDKAVRLYERRRKKKVMSLLNKDRFNLRRYIPLKLKKLVFDLASYINRNSMKNINIPKIGVSNYSVRRMGKGAIDLVLVATYPRNGKKI